MTKEENPQNQERGFPSFLESANPALPTFPPHDYYCRTRFTEQAKPQNHDGATRYLPDLPTDSSEEAWNEMTAVFFRFICPERRAIGQESDARRRDASCSEPLLHERTAIGCGFHADPGVVT